MPLKKLPRLKNYVIDFKLKQFRKISPDSMEFINFDSLKGKKLLKELKTSGYSSPPQIFINGKWQIDNEEV